MENQPSKPVETMEKSNEGGDKELAVMNTPAESSKKRKRVKKRAQRDIQEKEKENTETMEETETAEQTEVAQKSDKQKKKKKPKVGKESLDSTWFLSNSVYKSWLSGYASRPLSFCQPICPKLLEKLDINCVRKLKQSSLWYLVNVSQVAYPRLVRLFYANLQKEEGSSLVLSSMVAGVKIKIDHVVFSKVLNCPAVSNTLTYPNKKETIALAKSEFYLNQPLAKQATHTILKLEPKILFTFLMRSLLPKDNSKDLISDRILLQIHSILNGLEIDMPTLVMTQMLTHADHGSKYTCAFANLLTPFFKHFKIPLAEEEKVTSGFGMVSESTFKNLGIVQNSKGEWTLELDSKPSFSAESSSRTIQDRFDGLDHEVESLKLGLMEISLDVKQIQSSLAIIVPQIADILSYVRMTDPQQEAFSRSQEEKGSDAKTGNKNQDIDSDTVLGEVLKRKKGKAKVGESSGKVEGDSAKEGDGDSSDDLEDFEESEEEETDDEAEASPKP